MKRAFALLVAVVFGLVGSVVAIDLGSDHGKWPKSWPPELEPLRTQSETWESGAKQAPPGSMRYEISFTDRKQFEAAWPYILKVKTNGAPIILKPGPRETTVATLGASEGKIVSFCGVIIHGPEGQRNAPPGYGQPRPDEKAPWPRWNDAYVLELFVDGKIVDLNRIRLPADTPIIDRRFEDKQRKASAADGD